MSVNVASGKELNARFDFPVGAQVFPQGSNGHTSLLKTAAAMLYTCNA
jgi:hypothetical protein